MLVRVRRSELIQKTIYLYALWLHCEFLKQCNWKCTKVDCINNLFTWKRINATSQCYADMRTRQVGRTEILLCKVVDLIFCQFSEILDQCKIIEEPFNESGIKRHFIVPKWSGNLTTRLRWLSRLKWQIRPFLTHILKSPFSIRKVTVTLPMQFTSVIYRCSLSTINQ